MHPEELADSSISTPAASSTLVYRLDIFILILILVFSLFNIPRAFVYIANHRSEVFQGYFLRSTTQSRFSELTPRSTEKGRTSLEFSLPALEHGKAPKQPWHLPMYFRHPAASFAQYRVFGNYTVIQVLIMAGYTVTIFYAAFYESNPFSYPKRIGWVVASQIPFVYAFASKNNVIGLLVGVGYEKLNFLHRHVGRLMVIGANVHAIGYIYKWTLAGNISQKITQLYVLWGIVALVCFNLLGVLSLRCIRTKSYSLFFGTHVVSFVVILFAACCHRQACIPYAIAGSVVYGLDHIFRALKTRFTTATLQTIPELELARLDMPSLKTGWRPGQHVRLRVLSTAMGLWGMTEVHPFTIASATNTEEGLVLMCKKTGTWTQKLYKMAQEPERRVKVIVEGPYGGIGDTTFSNYSGAMLVAGGSGVTFVLSAVQDLVLAGIHSRVQVIEVVWCVRDPAALEIFIPLFSALVSRGGLARLRISVFYTRVASRSLEGLVLPPGVTLMPGRPRIEEILKGFVASLMSKSSVHGVFVGACGPAALVKDVANAVRTLDAASKKAVGGVQFHEEIFAW